MLLADARRFVKQVIGDREATQYLESDTLLDLKLESQRQFMAEALPNRKLYRNIKSGVCSIVTIASSNTSAKNFDYAAQFPSGITDFVRFANDFVVLRLADDTGNRYVCRVYNNQNEALNRSDRFSQDNATFNTRYQYVPVVFDGRNFLIADESSPITSGTVGDWQLDFSYVSNPVTLSGSLDANRLNEVHEYLALMLTQADIQQTAKGEPAYKDVKTFLLNQLKVVGP